MSKLQGHDLVVPSSFYIWIHSGPQLITALSEGEGTAKPGGEGLLSSCKISASLTTIRDRPPRINLLAILG
jgi:hypothetical protein